MTAIVFASTSAAAAVAEYAFEREQEREMFAACAERIAALPEYVEREMLRLAFEEEHAEALAVLAELRPYVEDKRNAERDGARFWDKADFYSDYYKDVYGHRPRVWWREWVFKGWEAMGVRFDKEGRRLN